MLFVDIFKNVKQSISILRDKLSQYPAVGYVLIWKMKTRKKPSHHHNFLMKYQSSNRSGFFMLPLKKPTQTVALHLCTNTTAIRLKREEM